MSDGLSRRELLAGGAAGALALALAGCGGLGAAKSGSTLRSTWQGTSGSLQVEPGAHLIGRTDLGPAAPLGRRLATLGHLTDAHVMDAESPARVPFLSQLGQPFNSTFRPQEALTAQVMDGAVRALDALAPDAVIQGGDLIDNAQENELIRGLALLAGGRVDPGSGARRYHGVQEAGNADPFYYRPDIDAPRYPDLLDAATRRFHGAGLKAPWYPVLGDHDLLVQGILKPTSLTDRIARGARAVWRLPSGLEAPPGAESLASAAPDGLPDPGLFEPLIRQLLSAPGVDVPADPHRRELGATTVVTQLRRAASLPRGGALLDYTFDVGRRLRVVVLDLVRRGGGSDGIVHAGQSSWLARQLSAAGDRWVLVVTHQPLTNSVGGAGVLALLDRHPRVVAVLSGHTHKNTVEPRRAPAGGYWLISTASLVDYPQQARALRLFETPGGGVALQAWMLDHVPTELGDISRELSYLDARGGRPQGFAGDARDRDVTLFKPAVT
ncbi:MAG TPA: metallophosphoesterase [Solirubrobacterales bacterium]|jgi:3',5'-cyclic AMP phosphodiesterase CpdA|nr:metallophosphoesterase [Solirubrobacterales bacterium]